MTPAPSANQTDTTLDAVFATATDRVKALLPPGYDQDSAVQSLEGVKTNIYASLATVRRARDTAVADLQAQAQALTDQAAAVGQSVPSPEA